MIIKEKIPTILGILIILFFFFGAIAIFIYQYIMIKREYNFELLDIKKELVTKETDVE